MIEKLYLIMKWIRNLVYLNFICLIFSLPLFTLIPSIYALAVSTHFLLSDRDRTNIFTIYSKNFKKYFFKSYQFFLPWLVLLYVMGLDIRIFISLGQPAFNILSYAFIVLTLLLFVIFCYGFALITSTDFTFRQVLVLAYSLSVRYFLHSLLLIVCLLLWSFLFVFQTGMIVLMITSFPVFVICFVGRHAFNLFSQRYLSNRVTQPLNKGE